MKKATLEHVESKGFVLINESSEIISQVGAGENEDDIDWDLVERHANELGYTLY